MAASAVREVDDEGRVVAQRVAATVAVTGNAPHVVDGLETGEPRALRNAWPSQNPLRPFGEYHV